MNNDQQFLAQAIRARYTEQEHTQLDALTSLDNKVKRPPLVFAYVFGSLAAIVMGSGMSLVMTDIGAILGIANAMVPGIVIGAVGLIMAVINYPIYKRFLGARRKKYAQQIIELSDRVLEGER